MKTLTVILSLVVAVACFMVASPAGELAESLASGSGLAASAGLFAVAFVVASSLPACFAAKK